MKDCLIHRAKVRHDTNRPATKQAVMRLLHCTFAFLLAAKITAEPTPDAKDILATVRMQQTQQQIDLQGQLRQDATVVPFRLTQNGALIKYSFANPPEALQLRLGETDSKLEQLSGSGVEKITPAQFDRKVRGMPISYEDLALKFLYWPTARVLGEEPVRSRRCWKIQLQPPSHESQYSNVTLWVDRNSGALMEMEGHDWNGNLVKRFEVISAQKIDNRWFLKQMRVEELDPATHKVRSRTYLEIKK
jgi:hypothetical protein